MQSPNRDNRDHQNHEVGGDIDHACTDQDGVLIYTLLPRGHQCAFPNAFESDGQDESDSVEEIPPKGEPDRPPDESPAGTVGNEETLVEEDYRYLGEEHPYSGDDLDVVEMLVYSIRLCLRRILCDIAFMWPLTAVKSLYFALETFHKSLPPP